MKVEHGQVVFGQSEWYGCKLCYNTLYCRPQDIVKHMRKAHQEEFVQPDDYLINKVDQVNLPCQVCGENTLLSRYCNKHRKMNLVKEKLTCYICNVSFSDKRILQAHINIEHGKQVHVDALFECFVCHQCCDQIYLGREDFVQHMSQSHGTVLTTDEERNYIVNSLDQILYSCKCCQEPCLFSGFCRQHDADVNISNCNEHPEAHACHPCNVLYNDCNDFWIHLFSHHTDETLYCNLCEKSSHRVPIRAPSLLMQHWKQYHRPSVRDEQLRVKSEIVIEGQTQFLCNDCSVMFENFELLKQHDVTHHSSEGFLCDVCSKCFNAKRSLRDHRRKVHGIHMKCKTKDSDLKTETMLEKDGVVQYKCPHCKIQFKTFPSLKAHLSSNHNDKAHTCTVCGTSFGLAKRLSAHYRSVHAAAASSNSHEPDTRLISDHSVSLVKSEVQVVEGDRIKYKCPLCNRVYTSFSETKRHFEIHSGVKKYSCSMCNKCFFIKNRLSEHYRRVHQMKVSMARTNEVKRNAEIDIDGVTKFKCNVCDFIFKRYDSLRLHLRVHSGERPYTCDVCGKSFVAKKHLNRHYNSSHAGFGYLCNICGRVMSDSTNYKDHMDNHKGEKKYTCEICGTGFMYKSSLHHHKFSHSKERMFQCCYCEKKYMSPKTLKEHEQTHTAGNVRHKCDTCGSEFNTRKNMLRHTKVHTTERPYVCEYCNVNFKERKSLVRHYKIHRGVNVEHQALHPPLPPP
uniref:Zinc finger protein 26 n=1 Tax=Cacopsylla melanoneura TaxID=428564 RepID=A0A8D9B9V5_9HEMI